MKDQGVVDTMGDDMLEVMEQKNGKICYDYDYSCGEEHKMDGDTYSLSGALGKIIQIKKRVWISETTNGEKYRVKVKNIVYKSQNG